MNYYIVTKEVFENMIQGDITFAHHLSDTCIVTSTEDVSDTLHEFANTTELANHTGLDEWEIDETEYLSGL